MGLILLIGQVRRGNIGVQWSNDPTISPSIFPHTTSRKVLNLFDKPGILVTSHQKQGAGRLFKIWPMYEYFLQNFMSVYSPKQGLSLDEDTIMAGKPEI